ncbi:hypothetical protein [Methylocystis parvus]|uniref:hypothetical protein n=1 Tax=Methylocystis parvus TaxID=134 RepID=UPI003C71D540
MFKLQAEPPQPATLKDDLLRGAKEIADFLGVSERQGFHLCATGQLPGVFKLGRIWHARRSTLIEELRRREQGGA